MNMAVNQWRIGQVVPIDGRRGLQEGHTAPMWFALTTPPQKEAAARAYLEAQGIHAFYPNEERHSIVRNKRRTRKVPIVCGYVFARFTGWPQWDVIQDRPFFTGVVALGIRPYVIPRGTIRRLRGLTVEAAERRRELREMQEQLALARMPQEGDKATITQGPLAGFLVDVTGISGGVAFYLLPGGIKGQARAATLERKT